MKQGNFFRLSLLAVSGSVAGIIGCGLPIVIPTPTPRATIVPTCTSVPTATMTAVPTNTPAPTTTATPVRTATHIDPVPCHQSSTPHMYKYVRDAILKYKNDHPDRLFNGKTLAPKWWDSYYFEVVDTLNNGSFTVAVVDDCGGSGICGEIAVKEFGTVHGKGFHEQYHILVSSGDLRWGLDSFRAVCTPSGF